MTKRLGANASRKSDLKGPAMSTAFPLFDHEVPCSSYHDGHTIYPLKLRRAISRAHEWEPCLVDFRGSADPITIFTSDAAVGYRSHNPLPLLTLLRSAQPGPESSRWNGRLSILGILNDPRVGAGYRYFSLADQEIRPCVLSHDTELSLRFEAAMEAFALPCYERNAGSSA